MTTIQNNLRDLLIKKIENEVLKDKPYALYRSIYHLGTRWKNIPMGVFKARSDTEALFFFYEYLNSNLNRNVYDTNNDDPKTLEEFIVSEFKNNTLWLERVELIF